MLSVAHVAVVPADRLTTRFPDKTRLVPVDAPGRLVYDHPDIITLAVDNVRARYEAMPDPDRLLGATGATAAGGRGRPAELFRRSPDRSQ